MSKTKPKPSTPKAKAAAPAAKTAAKPAAKGTDRTAKAAPAKPNGKPVDKSNGHKSPFSTKELEAWRQQLLDRRAEISSDIAHLEKDAMEAEDGHTTPQHTAERGSDADLQDVSLSIAGDEKETIWQIDRALRKIEEGSPVPFGLCEFTKHPIPKSRLELIPWTPLSIEGVTHMESNGLTLEDVLADE